MVFKKMPLAGLDHFGRDLDLGFITSACLSQIRILLMFSQRYNSLKRAVDQHEASQEKSE